MKLIILLLLVSFPVRANTPEIIPLDSVDSTNAAGTQIADVGDLDEESIWVSNTPLNFGMDLQYGQAAYPNYQIIPGVKSTGYGSLASLNFEWIALQNVGKVGLGLGLGAFGRSGIGAGSGTASVLAFLLDLSLSYRADFWDDQMVVPFVRIGREWTWFKQDSGAGLPQFSAQHLGWTYGVGLQVLLDLIDIRSSNDLEKATGINNTYLTVEYSYSQSDLGQALDLTRSLYRASLRFEI